MLSRWLVLLLALALAPSGAHAEPPLLFAAASLKPALDALAAEGALGAPAPTRVYAASSQLARQIAQGAPASVLVSADRTWMDYLAERRLIAADSRVDLLGNALVLVAPAGAKLALELTPGADLVGALRGGRLAVALPDAVPAGRYAKQALAALGLWDAVAPRLAPAQDVRAALNLVVRGEAPLGVVYRSDAVSEPQVRVVATFPPDSHAPIVYPAAVVAAHDDAAARALLAALRAPAAQATFRRFGFDAPPAR
ncbi:MAG: molybdate ABC transporter substrate-binding protein [Mizugakiibacter sp.]|uniref:molybdate ABC transporter substrate-binding protein n=1 Tax=Mizugakiibacter sp. TaxID=1972610 RepID=UPI0031C657DF|nr:molybdate ABC transporter substrate-binding protein [Xanthomonadaceae bacterium]